MDPNKLTQKCQEAIHAANSMAVRFGHQQIDAEHLLLALCQQDQGLVPRLFQKMDVQVNNLIGGIERELEKMPKVSGPGAEPGKVLVTQRFNQIVVRAEEEANGSKMNLSQSSI